MRWRAIICGLFAFMPVAAVAQGPATSQVFPIQEARVFAVPVESRQAAQSFLAEHEFIKLDDHELSRLFPGKAFDHVALENLSPYLIKVFVVNPGTGRFSISIEGGYLMIRHGSLGRVREPATFLPLVIFLEVEPRHISVTEQGAL